MVNLAGNDPADLCKRHSAIPGDHCQLFYASANAGIKAFALRCAKHPGRWNGFKQLGILALVFPHGGVVHVLLHIRFV